MKTKRRTVIKELLVSVAGLGLITSAKAGNGSVTKEAGNIINFQELPLFSNYIIHGGLVYLSGMGAHIPPFDIKSHTEIVLKGLERELIAAGSSMEKVLKVNVYLDDITDYQGMNEVFRGRFGSKPPVRTTVAVAKGGVPVNSLVEMDCIAYL